MKIAVHHAPFIQSLQNDKCFLRTPNSCIFTLTGGARLAGKYMLARKAHSLGPLELMCNLEIRLGDAVGLDNATNRKVVGSIRDGIIAIFL